jgi:hypothetical protein
MNLASKSPPCGLNCEARHDATDILTDTSPAFRPFFAHGLWPRTPVSRSAPGERPNPLEHRLEQAPSQVASSGQEYRA